MFQQYFWALCEVRVKVAAWLLAVAVAAVTFEYELPVYSGGQLIIMLLLLGRALPTLAILFVSRRWAALWRRSSVTGACLAIIASGQSLLHLLCAQHPDLAPTSEQCNVMRAGAQAWLPIALAVLVPLYASAALLLSWVAVVGAGVATACCYIGMVLAVTPSEPVATAVLLCVAAVVTGGLSAYMREADLRAAYRREAGSHAKLRSLLQATLKASSTAAVGAATTITTAADTNLHITEVLKRSDVMLMELDSEGMVQYVSAACGLLAGCDASQLLQTDFLSLVHFDDRPVVEAAIKAALDRIPSVPPAEVTLTGRHTFRGHATQSLPFVRVLYRRRRPPPPAPAAAAAAAATGPEGSGSMVPRSGTMWIECEIHPVVRRPGALPGYYRVLPAGPPSLLLVEKDVTAARAAALDDVQLPNAAMLTTSPIMGFAAQVDKPASAAAEAVIGSGHMSVAFRAGAPSAATAGSSRRGLHASSDAHSYLSDASEGGITASALSAHLTTGAGAGAGAGAGGDGAAGAYDPLHERTLYAALASLQLAAADTAAETQTISAALQTLQSASSSSASGTETDRIPFSPSSTSSSNSASNSHSSSSWAAVRSVVEAAAAHANYTQQLATATLAVARYRAQYLPQHPKQWIDVRKLLAHAVTTHNARVHASAASAAAAAASPAAASSDSSSSTAPAAPQPTQRLVPLTSVTVDNVPDAVLCDEEALFRLINVAVAALGEVTGPAGLSLRVCTSPPPTRPNTTRENLRFEFKLDLAGIGGFGALTSALGGDALTAGRGAFAAIPPGTTDDAPTHLAAMLQASKSYKTLLPVVRHLVLCMGGGVHAGSDLTAPTTLAQPCVLVLDVPIPALALPIAAGPTVPDPAVAAACVAEAPVTRVPSSVLVAHTLPPPQMPPPLPPGGRAPGPVTTANVLQHIATGLLPQMSPAAAVLAPSAAPAPAAAPAVAPAPAPSSASAPAPAPVPVLGGGAGAMVQRTPSDGDPSVEEAIIFSTPRGAPAPAPAPAPAAAPAPAPPLAPAAAPTATAAAAATATAAAAAATRAPPSGNQDVAGTHILFVDDEEMNRRLGARMLSRLQCTCVAIEDGDGVRPALDAAAKDASKRPFDMIMMDIVMQRTDGAVTCSKLRAEGCNLPIVAMTGITHPRDVARFLAAGFDLVLAKPFDIGGLRRGIMEARIRRERLRWAGGGGGGGGGGGSGVASPAPASTMLTSTAASTAASISTLTAATNAALPSPSQIASLASGNNSSTTPVTSLMQPATTTASREGHRESQGPRPSPPRAMPTPGTAPPPSAAAAPAPQAAPRPVPLPLPLPLPLLTMADTASPAPNTALGPSVRGTPSAIAAAVASAGTTGMATPAASPLHPGAGTGAGTGTGTGTGDVAAQGEHTVSLPLGSGMLSSGNSLPLPPGV